MLRHASQQAAKVAIPDLEVMALALFMRRVWNRSGGPHWGLGAGWRVGGEDRRVSRGGCTADAWVSSKAAGQQAWQET